MTLAPNAVSLRDTWLRVHLPALGDHADFHYRWLRHNCDLDRHPSTGERTSCSSELPDDVRATSASVDGERLLVTWGHDGRESAYDLAWLAAHAYAVGRADVPPPPNDVAALSIDGTGLSLDERVVEALAKLDALGAALVRRDPTSSVLAEDETEAIVEAFAARGLRIVGTHFGRIEDLRTDNTSNQNTDQLGYTDAPVDLHTDQPFLEHPPRYQLLQAIRPADSGGDSYVVDALAAARHLESVDRRAFELLTTVPVRFHRKQRAFESVVDAPILRFDGASFLTRYSYFTLAPFARPFAETLEWYRAYDAYARLVRDPRHQYRFSLRAGDFLLYDNHRMLHARTGFQGARWVRGIYFNP